MSKLRYIVCTIFSCVAIVLGALLCNVPTLGYHHRAEIYDD
jgi:hypothetical protein